MNYSLLKINNLNTRIFLADKVINAVNNLDLELKEKEILSIVGESGSGKTISMLSVTNLLPKNAKIISGEIYFNGEQLDLNNEKQLNKIRGSQISYIFQDPNACLNPLFNIGEQIKEIFVIHNKMPDKEARKAVLEALELVNLEPAKKYYSFYPHQLSGGMNQRVMIAMAIASKPKLLIADEPTSSLDRITEIKILNLLLDLNKKLGISIIFITHNISIARNFADRIAIMYKGKIVETGNSKEIIDNPKQPYTQRLLACIPKRKTILG